MLIYLAKMYSAYISGDTVRTRCAWSSPHGNDPLLLPLNLTENQAFVSQMSSSANI